MITVIIRTLDDERRLAHTLAALVPAAAESVVRDVIVVDAGSRDGTAMVADAAGCRLMETGGTVGGSLRAAAAAARGSWLLFIPPGAVPDAGWHREAGAFVERVESSGQTRAASFRLARPDFGWRERAGEAAATVRSRLLALPRPEQGLLVSAAFYRSLGGHRDLPALVEIDLARRIGRRRLALLRASAASPRGIGGGSVVRNALCLALMALRVPAGLAARLAG